MEAEEQIILLRQQIVALRKALADAQREANDVKKQLDKEVSSRAQDKAWKKCLFRVTSSKFPGRVGKHFFSEKKGVNIYLLNRFFLHFENIFQKP